MNSEENENQEMEIEAEEVKEIKYPIFLHRESSEEEEAKDGSLYKSKIVHSKAEHALLGEEYVEDLKDIKKVAAVYHKHEPVEATMIPSSEPVETELPESAADMTVEQLREVLAKHGYKPAKLAKMKKEKLLEIFSS